MSFFFRVTITVLTMFLMSGCDTSSDSMLLSAPKKPSSIRITFTHNEIALGLSTELQVTAYYDDGSSKNITDMVRTEVSQPDKIIQFLNQEQNSIQIKGIQEGYVLFRAFFENYASEPAILNITHKNIQDVQITPSESFVPIGFYQQMQAILLFSDDSVQDVTNDPTLTWSVDNHQRAAIDNSGLVIGLKTGPVIISASGNVDGQPIKHSVTLNVTDAIVTALQISPNNISLPVGLSQQMQADALLSDQSVINITAHQNITWRVDNPALATINESGLLTALSKGDITVTAEGTANNAHFIESVMLNISDTTITKVTVTPHDPIVPIGFTQQMEAIATLSNNTERNITVDPAVSWLIDPSSLSIASISHNGFISAHKSGKATVSASVHNQIISDVVTVNVVDKMVTGLLVSTDKTSIPIGLTQQIHATAEFSDGSTQDITKEPALFWSVNDDNIATIDSTGLLTGIKRGNVIVTASGNANNQSFSQSIELRIDSKIVTSLLIAPEHASIPAGLTQQMVATAIFSDQSELNVTASPAISWSVNDSSLATINNMGKVSTIRKGDVIITASGIVNNIPFNKQTLLTITPEKITHFSLTPENKTSAANYSINYQIIAHFTNGTNTIVNNNNAKWKSLSPNLANFSTPGHLVLISPGINKITADINYNGENSVLSTQVIITPGDQIIVTKVGKGLNIGSAGLSCLSDGIWNTNYDYTCVSYSLGIPNFGWKPNDTYFNLEFLQPIKMTALSVVGYWRQVPLGSLGTWQVFGCPTRECDSTIAISEKKLWSTTSAPWNYNDGIIYINTHNVAYKYYQLQFIQGPTYTHGGAGSASFTELFYTQE
ncbi:MAG: Ig-like domain-containing protein [Plesiomonas sp.]